MNDAIPPAIPPKERLTMTRRPNRFAAISSAILAVLLLSGPANAELIRTISVDGDFSDWAGVPSYTDPAGGPGVLHDGIPDTHDTDHNGVGDVPSYVNHPDIDLLEYKFAHDEENLYAYFRATGEIGRTSTSPARAGRYYVIVTIDVDDDDVTGYPIHEGGYYPTSGGYDMNMEVEFYNGEFNTGHYLNHGCLNPSQLAQAVEDQKNGIVNVLPGTYDYYSQWVWFDGPDHRRLSNSRRRTTIRASRSSRIRDRSITVFSKSPFPTTATRRRWSPPSAASCATTGAIRSWRLGKTIDISFSLEASGELAPGGEWASDTGDPIIGYYLALPTEPVAGDLGGDGCCSQHAVWMLSGRCWRKGPWTPRHKAKGIRR